MSQSRTAKRIGYGALIMWTMACATAGQGLADEDDGDAGTPSAQSGTVSGAGGSLGSGAASPTSSASGQGGSATVTSSAANTSASNGAGGNCPESPCRVTLPQCGCPSGQRCTLDQQQQRTCMPNGNTAIGQTCSSLSCVAGSMCLGDATFANCKKFCDTDNDCNAPGGLCVIQMDDGMGGAIKEKWCSDNCDPISGTGCSGSGVKCEIAQENMGQQRFFTICVAAGNVTQGGACSTLNDCAQGYGCINYMGSICAKWCNVNAPSCPGLTTCAGFQTPMFIGNVEYGVCIN